MHVALLTANNAPEYRRLMLHAYEHAADAFTSTEEERAAEPDTWWVRRIADPDGMCAALGAFHGDDLVGTVALEFSRKPKTRHKVLVIGMYVLASFRGLGAGRDLLQAAIQYAESRAGTRVMTLSVTRDNQAALALYRDAGFEVFGTEPMAILTPTGFKDKVHMWRGLGSETSETTAA